MMYWFLDVLVLLLMGMGGVAFITLLERKILGLSQLRLGPNKVTFFGLFQPASDGVKLLMKQMLVTNKSQIIFFLIPFMLFMLFMILFSFVLPWPGSTMSMKLSVLIYFSFLGISAYVIILTGWSSLSNFSKLGSLRGMLQSISYEVTLILAFMIIMSNYNDYLFNTTMKMNEFFIMLWIISWYFICLMESNRAPFDLLEGESELISGFNVEMSSINFVYIFLSEYGMVMIFAIICSISLTNNILLIESLIFSMVFLLTRSCYPRVRYDNMMSFMWKEILPINLFMFLLFCMMK